MRTLLRFAILAILSTVTFAQNPLPVAAYLGTGSPASWSPWTAGAAFDPLGYTPSQVALYCQASPGGAWTPCAPSGGGSMTWPTTPGITVCTGTPCTAWGTSLAAPAGAIVGTTDTQTLTNKTVDGVTPAVMGYVDPTSSIQTQLNAKAASNASTTVNGQSCALGSACTISAGAMSNITGAVTVTCSGACSVSGGIVTVTTTGASITISSIPGTYNDLRFVMSGQVSGSGQQDIFLQVNGDTTTSYARQAWGGNGASPVIVNTAGTATAAIGNWSGSAVASFASFLDATIYNYTSTSFFKSAWGSSFELGSSTSQTTDLVNGWVYSATPAAITSIKIFPSSSANFIVGTTFRIYGIS